MEKNTNARPINAAGSVLVGAITLSILMAIAGLSFMLVAVSGLNNDTAALQDLEGALCVRVGRGDGPQMAQRHSQ